MCFFILFCVCKFLLFCCIFNFLSLVMPVKKTTKSPAKNVKAVEKKMEPVVVKSPSVKKSISEKTSSGVIVKEKAMSNSCNSYGECKVGKFLMMLILLVNTVLLVMIFVYSRSGLQTQFRQVLEEFEMHRVG